MNTVFCPTCGGDGNLLVGQIDTDVYDGVLYWICMHCGIAFPRDFGSWKNRQEVSSAAAREYNQNRASSHLHQNPTGATE